MSIDNATVAHIARLARIRVPEEDRDRIAGELNNILGWVEQLAGVDTDGVPPMTSVVEMRLAEREDTVDDGGYPDRVLANAPRAEGGFFAVPKVVE
jgi:aspartyl-tRNA(Asn)/glutamyl-tRNA(Gln) amidotransferase subunit C